MNLKVSIDDNSGFCFGVVYAIQMAEDFLDEYGELYCLGDIVHNDEEVARLRAKGLKIISNDDLKEMHDVRVLIRAHGEPPETYKLALENNIELIDASCPVVLKLQHRVREAFDDESDAPIYIYGKHGHAEVKGLVGQTLGQAVVFEDIAELDNVQLPPKITLFSQTTKDMRKLYGIRDTLKERGVEVNFNDTLCRQVSNRDLELRNYAKKFDHIVFVSGKKSSNGKVLYNVCKENNPNSYFVSSVDEIEKSWFHENEKVGICGATSTPLWLMEEVKTHLEKL
ncbi:MAG: 4-hydroxy-3-methylbut-2-enyl diphosphate reductase [Sphingobacteriales bacterium]|nr:MAG: 4-hydroxy-3-methylbut-2-enyl diphosphate reductase [Sphingobacteriales bacterium]